MTFNMIYSQDIRAYDAHHLLKSFISSLLINLCAEKVLSLGLTLADTDGGVRVKQTRKKHHRLNLYLTKFIFSSDSRQPL